MLLIDGDPTEDISLVNDYERNFLVIVKNGKIYKNTLSEHLGPSRRMLRSALWYVLDRRKNQIGCPSFTPHG